MTDQSYSLWKLFLLGDKTAFECIITQHFRGLFNYGTRFSDDEELIKDTIQELFIRLWEKKSNLCEDVNLKAYLTASLRRALHRKIQSQSRFQHYEDIKENIDLFELEISVEDKLIESESGKSVAYKIAQNLETLPERQKEVIYLKFFQELSRDEISKTMGISPQTVSNLLQQALKKLRTQITRGIMVCLIFFNKVTKQI